MTDFKTEVLFDLVDSLYRQKHGLTVTGNYVLNGELRVDLANGGRDIVLGSITQLDATAGVGAGPGHDERGTAERHA
mgnify:CR=1 FL=1